MYDSKWRLLLLFLLPTVGLWGQSDNSVRFEAFVDAKQVLLGSQVEISFSVINGEETNFTPPSFEGFQLLSGPSRSVRTTVINGRVSSESSYVYLLRPEKIGRLRIGAATMTANGKNYQTEPLTVEVIEGSPNQPGSAFFLQAEISSQAAFVGQQLVLDYKLYTTEGIEGANPIRESDYQGFYAREVRRFDNRPVREVVEGKEYVTRILKRVALYPQQSGTLTIDSYQTLLGVIEEDESRSSFFLRRQLRQEPVETLPLTIVVRPLPNPAPEAFAGAIGNFEIDTYISRDRLSTDDVLKLSVRITGNGDLKRIQAPPLNLPDAFERYDPTVQAEEYLERSDYTLGFKEFEYLLVPQRRGAFELPMDFTYFDVDTQDYLTIRDTVFRITVTQGSNMPKSATGTVATDEQSAEETLRPYRRRVRLRSNEDTFLGSPPFWVLSGLPFLLALGFYFFRMQQERVGNKDPEEERRLKARQRAEAQLQTAAAFQRQGDVKGFYREVSQAMLGYVQNKLSVQTTELTKDHVEERLSGLGASAANIQDFRNVLQTCEEALYAARDSKTAMADTYETAVRVLAKMEAEI